MFSVIKFLKPFKFHYICLLPLGKSLHIPMITTLHYSRRYYANFIQSLNRHGFYMKYLCSSRNYSIRTANCWNCRRETKIKNLFFCEDCGSLQNVQNKLNYFKLFSLDSSFSIDSNNLTKHFRHLQSLVHPDKFSNKHEKEQEYSLEWSSLINKAYKTLLDPINRGEYILMLKGITLPKDNSSLDKEFLMDMMERNEEIEEADKDNVTNIQATLQEEKNELIIELGRLFSVNDIEKVKFLLVKMRYIKSLEKSIKEKIEKLNTQQF